MEKALIQLCLGCLQGRQVSHKDCGPCWPCHLPCPLAQPLPCRSWSVCSALDTQQPSPRHTGCPASARAGDSLFLATGSLPGSTCSPDPWDGRRMPSARRGACSRRRAHSMCRICVEHHRATVLVPGPGFLVALEARWLRHVL